MKFGNFTETYGTFQFWLKSVYNKNLTQKTCTCICVRFGRNPHITHYIITGVKRVSNKTCTEEPNKHYVQLAFLLSIFVSEIIKQRALHAVIPQFNNQLTDFDESIYCGSLLTTSTCFMVFIGQYKRLTHKLAASSDMCSCRHCHQSHR
jgi:hypothetical protein